MRTRLFFFSLHQAIFELHGVITMRISYDKLWNTMYHMFSSERRTVELICNNSVMDAIIYYTIVKEVLGEKWLTNRLFRLGTSRLADILIKEIEN